MKKILIIFVFIILITGCSTEKTDEPIVESKPPIENNDSYDVVVNLFHWNSCSHCKEEIEWLENVKDNYNYIKINYYEVEEYNELIDLVRTELGIEGTSVPVTVIGTDYFVGFGSAAKAKIMNTIEKYSKYEHCDLVSKVVNGEETLSCYATNITE